MSVTELVIEINATAATAPPVAIKMSVCKAVVSGWVVFTVCGRSLHVGHKALLGRCFGLCFFSLSHPPPPIHMAVICYLSVCCFLHPFFGCDQTVWGQGGAWRSGSTPPYWGDDPCPHPHTQSLANPLMGRLRDLHHAMRGAGRTGTVAWLSVRGELAHTLVSSLIHTARNNKTLAK